MFRSKTRVAAWVAAGAALIPSAASAAEAPRRTEELEQIVITASPFARNAEEIATIVGQISRDEILRHGGSNLADVLDEVPGVTGSGFAAGASRPVIRGFDANRVRILENGIGSFDVSDVGPDHGVPIDPLSAQKVEVVRGAATLRFGSQAIGGVVNAINNRIPLELSQQDVAAEAAASYGTVADSIQGSGTVDGKAGSVAFHLDGFARDTDNYSIPGGVQPNSYFRGHGFAGGASTFFGDSRLGGALVHYASRYGIPGEDTFIDMRQTKGLVGSSFAIDAGALSTLTVDGGYADYKHSEKDPTANNAVIATFTDKEWEGRTEALFGSVGPFASAALGAHVQRKNYAALGEGADYLSPTKTFSAAGFAFAEAGITSRMRLQLGARIEHAQIDGTPVTDIATSRDFTPISGSAGLVLDAAQGVTLGLTATSAARAPGQTELFARGPHHGPGTFELGDENLRLERANSLEATLRWRSSRIEFEGAAWAARFNNYIYGRLTGVDCDDDGVCGAGGDLREMIFEQRGATFRGLEGKVTATLYQAPIGSVGAVVLADVVRASFKGAGDVPRIPPYHVSGGLAWNSERVDASFMLKYTGMQNRFGPFETPTKGFASVDAQVAWRPFKEREVEVSLVGHNLTDRIQRNAISLNKDEVMLPGRDVRLVLRAAF